VTSLARPGGNVTGLSIRSPELRGKQLQLIREALPGPASVAVLANPTLPLHALDLKELGAAARSLKLQLRVVTAAAPSDLAEAVAAATKERAGALLLLTDGMFFRNRVPVVELATKARLPVIAGVREHAEAGCLLTYGVNLREAFRRAAWYVDRILKGVRPADLPIERPTTFDMFVNLKTARALGLDLPRSLLSRADQILE
jgi:putative ABC transport system substrate-binding protein